MKLNEYIKNYTKSITRKGYNDMDETITVDINNNCYLPDNIIKILAEHDITYIESTYKDINKDNPNPIANIGFSKTENLWYGWSHRAIYGFGINSKVDINNVGFVPSNREEDIAHRVRMYNDEPYAIGRLGELYEDYFTIIIKYKNVDEEETVEELYRNPKNYGKGKWTAKTMEDAKQMAIDFANAIN